MEEKLRFIEWEGEGQFASSESLDETTDLFHDLLDKKDGQSISDKKYISELELLIEKEPFFIDGYSHLSYVFLAQNKPQKALETALAGIAVGEKTIPDGFDGTLPWMSWSNRPFLRAYHGAVIANVRLRHHKEAVKLIERMLFLNPNDNQGVRFLYGSEVLRSGNEKRALEIFNELSVEYPPYCYELALIHIKNKNWVKAATALRLGFCGNSYVAEILNGNPRPSELNQWHSPRARTEVAKEYIEHYGAKWFSNVTALEFIRWLFNHSIVMTERAQITACREGLQWEHDSSKRVILGEREDVLQSAIDDDLSKQLVAIKTDRRGSECYPWEESDTARILKKIM